MVSSVGSCVVQSISRGLRHPSPISLIDRRTLDIEGCLDSGTIQPTTRLTMSTSTENIPATCKTLVQEVREARLSESCQRSHPRAFREKPSSSRRRLSQKWARTKFSSGSEPWVSIPSTLQVGQTRPLLYVWVLTIPSQTASIRARYLAYRFFPTQGAYIGCDFVGEVVKLGPNLKIDVKIGDKISATVVGSKCSSYSRARRKGKHLLTFQNLFSRFCERTRCIR